LVGMYFKIERDCATVIGQFLDDYETGRFIQSLRPIVEEVATPRTPKDSK
jgi:hypothetical protein